MADAEKIKNQILCGDSKAPCENCWQKNTCPYLAASNFIESQQEEIARLQPKNGKWIFTGQKNAYGGTVIQCPFCDDKYVVERPGNEHYCRNCGAYFGGDDKDG